MSTKPINPLCIGIFVPLNKLV